jgi:uncharacterized protein (DUF58 family)
MVTRELIRKIRAIELHTSRLVNDQLAGQYHSVFKGQGIAFDEVRQYQPGDDVRQIDWNVTARMREPFVKVFVEEREMTVMLLVDASASNTFGSRGATKQELAAELAAILAFSAIKNNDRVGLILFTEVVEKFVPPKKGKKHVLRVISEILSFRPQGRLTNINAALEFFGHICKRSSTAFLISDFATTGFERILKVTHRRHDLVPVQISDPLEEELPDLGIVYFEDAETGEVVAFDTSSKGAREYASQRRRERETREAMFRRMKIDFINLSTDAPYMPALLSFFRLRERRLRR